MNTEYHILIAAKSEFLRYSYHGTTIQKIAECSGTSHTVVHYYYRAKEILFEKVFCDYLTLFLDNIDSVVTEKSTKSIESSDTEMHEIAWFITIEIRNNSKLLQKILSRHQDLQSRLNSIFEKPSLIEEYEKLINEGLRYILLNGLNSD